MGTIGKYHADTLRRHAFTIYDGGRGIRIGLECLMNETFIGRLDAELARNPFIGSAHRKCCGLARVECFQETRGRGLDAGGRRVRRIAADEYFAAVNGLGARRRIILRYGFGWSRRVFAIAYQLYIYRKVSPEMYRYFNR